MGSWISVFQECEKNAAYHALIRHACVPTCERHNYIFKSMSKNRANLDAIISELSVEDRIQHKSVRH
jgi:hypothetical protein